MTDDGTNYADDRAAELAERRAAERQAVDEAGGGESEGFELSEEELIEHASHGDQHSTEPIIRDSSDEFEEDPQISGEADSEELPDELSAGNGAQVWANCSVIQRTSSRRPTSDAISR